MVLDNRGKYPSLWAAVESFAHKAGARLGIARAEQDRVEALEREVKELRWADESLKLASAFQVKLRWRFFSCKRRSSASASGSSPSAKHCKLPVSSLA